MAPIVESWHSHVDITVAMAVPAERPGEVASTGGRLIVMWGVSSPHKDFAISLNLGSHICFHAAGLPRGISTCCLKIFGTLVLWLGAVCIEVVVTEGMMRGFRVSQEGG